MNEKVVLYDTRIVRIVKNWVPFTTVFLFCALGYSLFGQSDSNEMRNLTLIENVELMLLVASLYASLYFPFPFRYVTHELSLGPASLCVGAREYPYTAIQDIVLLEWHKQLALYLVAVDTSQEDGYVDFLVRSPTPDRTRTIAKQLAALAGLSCAEFFPLTKLMLFGHKLDTSPENRFVGFGSGLIKQQSIYETASIQAVWTRVPFDPKQNKHFGSWVYCPSETAVLKKAMTLKVWASAGRMLFFVVTISIITTMLVFLVKNHFSL